MLHPRLAAERQAILAFLAASVNHLAAMASAVRGSGDSETLHQMRVELRRIRSVLGACGGALPAPGCEALEEECRWLAASASAVRDADVLIDRIPRLVPEGDGRELARQVGRERSLRRRELMRALRSKRAAILLQRLQELTRISPLTPGWAAQPVIARSVRKALRELFDAGQAIGTEPAIEAMHEQRKACKRLRYLLELRAGCAGVARGSALRGRLRKLQELLGEYQDLVTHAAALRRLADDKSGPPGLADLAANLQERADALQPQALERLAALREAKSRKRLKKALATERRLDRPATGTNGYCHGYADGRVAGLPVGKIVCVGRNYAAHAAELGNPVPETPLLFIKPPSAAVDFAPFVRIPRAAGSVHHEIEIALLIGRELTAATPEQARRAIAGIGLALDLTLRELQDRLKAKGQPWEIAKGFDGAAALGPFVPLDPALDLRALELRLAVNGRRRQAGSSAEMLTPIIELLCLASAQFSLWPGDVLLTGTPKGVGELKPGDRLSAELVGISRLRSTVVA